MPTKCIINNNNIVANKKLHYNSFGTKQNRNSLTGLQKRDVCIKKRNQHSILQVDLAKEYGVSEANISKIFKILKKEWKNQSKNK